VTVFYVCPERVTFRTNIRIFYVCKVFKILAKYFTLYMMLCNLQSSVPKTDVELDLTHCRSEVDITIVDRIHSLLNRQKPLNTHGTQKNVYWSHLNVALTQVTNISFYLSVH
jgi:hypothetical protein